MPGLLRGMARTAVIAGTATATSNAVNRRQASKNVAAYDEAQQQVAQQAPPPAAAPAAGEGDSLAQLERLGQLKAQGILTEEEFSAAKAKVLGI
ncbi:MAG: SHOCT domain-containing protein [Thermoleophilia bacterium]|nr:SHOCT domain-containing protein [Thermoleophilia bacterium]